MQHSDTVTLSVISRDFRPVYLSSFDGFQVWQCGQTLFKLCYKHPLKMASKCYKLCNRGLIILLGRTSLLTALIAINILHSGVSIIKALCQWNSYSRSQAACWTCCSQRGSSAHCGDFTARAALHADTDVLCLFVSLCTLYVCSCWPVFSVSIK